MFKNLNSLSKYGSNYLCLAFRHKSDKPLRDVVAEKVKCEQERIKEFVKLNGDKKIGEITVKMVYGGMRSMPALICETSALDPQEGIRFRGLSISECKEKLPTAKGGCEPLPEGMFWLLMTGEVPTEKQAKQVSLEWADRSTLPDYVVKMLGCMPKTLHPMTQLSCAVSALNHDSKFVKAYEKGIPKAKYWEYAYEDSMDLIAKVIVIAANIYSKSFRPDQCVPEIDCDCDWSANYARMLGYENPTFTELLRLYLTIHCDHESGNVSAHATHLVGSALSDPYISYASGLNGLAGPLHGLANQEVVFWIQSLQKEVGKNPPEDKIKEYVLKTLKSGHVIPGYGHAVLRKTDPRFTVQQEFAKRHIPDDEGCQLVTKIFNVVPPILKATKKVQNPYPNVDAHSGSLLLHYGMTELNYYTVLFGVSRALGVLAQLIWSRALGFPLERPKSLSTDGLIKILKKKAC